MKQLLLLATFLIAVAFLSCNGKREPREKSGTAASTSDTTKSITDSTKVVAHDLHTSANSLDWKGAYKGVLPCADCPGIETAITLDSGNAYTIKSKYLGKGSNSFEDHG